MEDTIAATLHKKLIYNLTHTWNALGTHDNAWCLEEDAHGLYMRSPLATSYFNMFWSDAPQAPPAVHTFFAGAPFLHVTPCIEGVASKNVRQTLYMPLTDRPTETLDEGAVHRVTTLQGCHAFCQLLRALLEKAHGDTEAIPLLETWISCLTPMVHTTQMYVLFQDGAPIASLQMMIDDQQTAGFYALSGPEDALETLLQTGKKDAYDQGIRHLICPYKPYGGTLTKRLTRLFTCASVPYAAIVQASAPHALKTPA